jgi:steroid Delta-isomerase
MSTSETKTAEQALAKFVDYWNTLTPDTLAKLGEIYRDDASFRDPFDDVRGIEEIRHIFTKMFVRLHEPRFKITETILQDNRAVLVWDFTFRIKRLKPELARSIHGTSLIRFDAEGRVLSHRDYWDAAGEMYEHLPVIGAMLRWVKRQMA